VGDKDADDADDGDGKYYYDQRSMSASIDPNTGPDHHSSSEGGKNVDIEIESIDLHSIIDQYEGMGKGTEDSIVAAAKTTETDNEDEWSCLTDGDVVLAFEWIASDNEKNDIESNANASSGWEISSEVDSVVTIEESIGVAGKASYADMAKKARSFRVEKPGKKADLQKYPKQIPTIQEEGPLSNQDGETFDALFVLEGVKCGHGGKTSMRFQGNQRRTQNR